MKTALLAILLVALASVRAAGAGAPEGTRVVMLLGGELLTSERHALAELGRNIGGAVEIGDASDAERAVSSAWLKGPPAAPSAWPAAWKEAATIVVLQVLPPTGKKPKRRSSGLGGILVFRTGQVAPVYVERIEGPAGAPLDSEELGKWIAGAARLGARK